MTFCNHCGIKLVDGSKFCPKCGTATNGASSNHRDQRQQEYAGKIFKCPNCGEVLKSFNANCPACGHELRSVKSTGSVHELSIRLNQIEATRMVEKPRSIYKAAYSESIVSKTDEQKATLIRTFPIPNTKEDLFEFIILAQSNVDSDLYKNNIRNSARLLSDAWKSKFEQAYQKAEVLFANAPEIEHIRTLNQKINTKIKKAKRSDWKSIGIMYLVLSIVFTAIMVGSNILGSKNDAKEVARLEAIVFEVEDCLKGGEYKLALINAESIGVDKYNYNKELHRQWDIKREYLIDKVIEEATRNGVILNRTPQDDFRSYEASEEESKKGDDIISDFEEAEENTSNSVDYFDVTIEKDAKYSYMSDEWNLYVATAITDNIVKIENWGKTLSPSKTVDYEYDVGTYRINDSVNGFSWVDDEHTAFIITLQDSKNSRLKKPQSVVFTVSISDGDKFKGSNYDKKGICYSIQNDDWHLYRAIPLTETTIKIEAWCRTISLGSFVYGYDVCVININDTTTDFEWADDEHTAFTITMQDIANSYYWKEPCFVAFTMENID